MSSHIKLGLLLIAFAFLCMGLGWFAAQDAHAATSDSNGDKLSPTPRDYQRLNACTNASVRHSVEPEDQVDNAINCAAEGKAVAKIQQKYPYKFGTPKKKDGTDEQNERVAYAWEISKWTNSTAFLNMIAGENGKFEEKRRSNVVTKWGREKSWGFCQLNSHYKPRYFKKEKDGSVRIFTDWKYQMRVCFKEFQSAQHHFYGGLKNNMWMYVWEQDSIQDTTYWFFNNGARAEWFMPEYDSLFKEYRQLYSQIAK